MASERIRGNKIEENIMRYEAKIRILEKQRGIQIENDKDLSTDLNELKSLSTIRKEKEFLTRTLKEYKEIKDDIDQSNVELS